MKQAEWGPNLTTNRTRKREFLDEMELAAPWAVPAELTIPYALEGRRGRPPLTMEAVLRIHFMQQWFTLSAPRWK